MKLSDRPMPKVDAIAERHTGRLGHNDAIAQYNDLLDLARRLESEHAALLEFCAHRITCRLINWPGEKCDCGYQALMDDINAARQREGEA